MADECTCGTGKYCRIHLCYDMKRPKEKNDKRPSKTIGQRHRKKRGPVQ